MDDKGFIFSIDAALMLIPLFIIVAAVSHINLTVPQESPYYDVQDAMDAIYYADNGSFINNLANGNVNSANTTLNSFHILDSYNTSYNLTYSINNGPYMVLRSRGTIGPNSKVASATRQQGNVTLKLYMWWG